jgi:hypothetical protein
MFHICRCVDRILNDDRWLWIQIGCWVERWCVSSRHFNNSVLGGFLPSDGRKKCEEGCGQEQTCLISKFCTTSGQEAWRVSQLISNVRSTVALHTNILITAEYVTEQTVCCSALRGVACFYETWTFFHTIPQLYSIFRQLHPVHNLAICLLKVRFNIILPYTLKSPDRALLIRVFH